MKKGLTSFTTGLANSYANLSNVTSRVRLTFLSEYRATDYKELQELNIIFMKYITEGTEKYNNLFEIESGKKAPAAKEHEINSCRIWDIKGNTSRIKSDANYLFNMISECYHKRLESHYALYVNSPSNLFLVELMRWVNNLGKIEPNSEMLADIKSRISYLNEIEKKEIFQYELNENCEIYLLIFNLRTYLEENLTPRIEAELSQECSREKFKKLALAADEYFKNTLMALFHLFTSCFEVTEVFHVNNLTVEDVYVKKVLQTTFGAYFKVISQISKESLVVNQTLWDLRERLLKSGSKDQLIGINNILGDNKSIEVLCKLLALMENYTCLIKAFNQAYHLSGAGGDILIYVGLCKEVTRLIECHEVLVSAINNHLVILKRFTKETYKEIIKQAKKSPWKIQYFLSKNYFQEAQINLEHVFYYLHNISKSMNKVRSHDYANKIAEQINQFKEMVVNIFMQTTQVIEGSELRKTLTSELKKKDDEMIAMPQSQVLPIENVPEIKDINIENTFLLKLNNETIYLSQVPDVEGIKKDGQLSELIEELFACQLVSGSLLASFSDLRDVDLTQLPKLNLTNTIAYLETWPKLKQEQSMLYNNMVRQNQTNREVFNKLSKLAIENNKSIYCLVQKNEHKVLNVLYEFEAFNAEERIFLLKKDSGYLVLSTISYDNIHVVIPETKRDATLKTRSINMRRWRLIDDQILIIKEKLEEANDAQELLLGNNLLTGAGINELFISVENMRLFSSIELFGNEIGNDGAEVIGEFLKNNTVITCLNLNDNKISADGIRKLSIGLLENKSLSFLDVGYNAFGDVGMKVLAKALEKHPGITNLRLGGNDLTDKSAGTLLKLVKLNSSIVNMDLDNNPNMPKELINEIYLVLEKNKQARLSLSAELSTASLQQQSFFRLPVVSAKVNAQSKQLMLGKNVK